MSYLQKRVKMFNMRLKNNYGNQKYTFYKRKYKGRYCEK